MIFSRKIYPDLKKHLKTRQITVITGMRRTGKTTLAKQLLSNVKSKNKLYIDLERLDNRDLFAQKNYDNIMHNLAGRGLKTDQKMYLALDEIQMLPPIASVLKYLYDTFSVKFIATGSSSYYLKNLFSESLAGRKKIFELYPLDFGEYLDFQGMPRQKKEDWKKKKFDPVEYERVRNYYERYIEFGGFPEVALASSDQERKDLISDILSSYINIDIKTLSDFRNEKNIYNLMKLLSVRIGTRLDYSKMSRLSGLSRPTVMNYIDFFEKTYLIKRIPVTAKSPDREIVKAQKIYFCDNGLAGFLADLSSGSKFENAVFNQLRHYGEIRYYALKSGREIDFILDGRLGLEAKETPLRLDQKKLDDLCRNAGVQKGRLVGRNAAPDFRDYIWGGEIR
jgi:predicted AAA+ superfamily ATPase